MPKQNPLIGQTISAIWIATDRKAMKFVLFDGESVVVRCDGDCCSSTWIENIEFPALGLPAKVTAVEDVEMPDLGAKPDQDVVAFYGCKITTDRGEILIDYRNESNGYYGGNLSWPGDSYYGGVSGQNISTEEWAEAITKE